MSLIFKIALIGLLRHPARAILTLFAVIAACCVVVWVVAGYDALASQFGDMASKSMGRYDFLLVLDAPGVMAVPDDIAPKLKADPGVASVEQFSNLRASIKKLGPDGNPLEPLQPGDPQRTATAPVSVPQSPADGMQEKATKGQDKPDTAAMPARQGQRSPRKGFRPNFGPTLVGTNAPEAPYNLLKGEWIRPEESKRFEGVLSANAAKQLQADIGDTLIVSVLSPRGGANASAPKEDALKLKVIGIIEQTPMLGSLSSRKSVSPMMPKGPVSSALYVSSSLAADIAGRQIQPSFLYIELKKGFKAEDFEKIWAPRMASNAPQLFLAGTQELKDGLEDGMMVRNIKNQAYTATGLSLLAAFFIIFTTLSMGINERIRQFAILRAVGFTRLQLSGVILVEGAFLAVLGWLGGLASGWLLLKIMCHAKPQLFQHGASLGSWCLALTAVCALCGSLGAAIVPAWRVTKLSPLDAMSNSSSTKPFKLPLALLAAGALLLLVNPLVTFVIPMGDTMRYVLYGTVGCSSMALGFILLSPLAVILAERLFGPLLAFLLQVEPRLLRQQLSSNMWRSIGTAVALTTGLGLYVSIQIWGYTMLGPFVPGKWLPDLLVAFNPNGIPDEMIEDVRAVKGVIPSQCLPLAVEQAKFAKDITGSQERSSVVKQDNVVLIGMDPDAAYGGPSPLMKLKFVKGSKEEAVAKIKAGGRHCLVPDHFAEQTGLDIGGRFALLPPGSPDKPVEYEIAGIVSLQGWHWMTKFSGLRRNSGRSAAMVFASFSEVRRDFNLDRISFLWMNLDEKASLDEIDAGMQAIAAKSALADSKMPGTGFGPGSYRPEARLTATSEVQERIRKRADGMIWGMSELPLIILIVTSLGVVNTVMASVRARRWEMGVLRSLGVSRSALLRLIIAEGLLIGLVACLLSLSFGVVAGFCGVGISQYVSFFGGLHPALILPWGMISIGFAMALGLCLIAAIWPAVATGREEPLKLLQAGRGTM
ncbi:MAG: hypothetical protein A2X49_11150 [Lentisphaerae bacterium GWF2_52_8]|nr:MAG: hypothetical protein A2X49_11150 [Lentisphaerae bacterium GWF2_52_8]